MKMASNKVTDIRWWSQIAHFCKVAGSLRKEEKLGIRQAKFYLIPALKH